MQKVDAISTKEGSQVTVIRNSVTYKAIVLRAPTFKDGTFRPTQFKVQILGDSEYAGNRYVSYTAVHTPQADKAQRARIAEEAKAKAEREAKKVASPKATLKDASDLDLLKALADRLGYTLQAK